MADNRTFYCEKCNRTMSAEQFYGSNNLDKYPDGKLKQCKKCVSMHVDNFNPDTYLWILQECDVPYIPDEWNKLLASYGKDKSKLTGMTILGRYLSKMKQFKLTKQLPKQHLLSQRKFCRNLFTIIILMLDRLVTLKKMITSHSSPEILPLMMT